MPALTTRRTVWTLAIAAALVASITLALPYVASTRLVGDRIAHEMGAWTGLDVGIGKAPEISVWPGLQANLSDVTFAKPGGEVVLTVDRVEVELSALAALGGDIDFTTARFVHPTLRIGGRSGPLSPPAAGRMAQAFQAAREIAAENSAEPDTRRLPPDAFGIVSFDDGRVVSVAGDAESELATGLTGQLDWKRLNGAATATAAGTVNGEPFSLNLSSSNPLLLLGGAATKLSLDLKSGPANIAFEGTAGLGQNPYADGMAKLSAPSMRRMLDWRNAAASGGPTGGSMSVESRVVADRTRIRLEEASITLDGNPAHGALDVLLTGKLPKVSGTLAFDTLDLGAFLSAFTPLDGAADKGPGAIDADFANRLNLDLRLSAAHATAGSFTLSDIAATARSDEELAAFDISDGSAFGGAIQAGLRFDRRTGTRVEARLLVSDIDGAAFGAAAGLTRLTPTGHGTVSLILKGEGQSWEELLAHAGGSLSANFGPGTLAAVDLDGLIARVRAGAPFAFSEIAAKGSQIDGLDLKATLADGRASIDKAEIRAPLHTITLAGTAPLAGGELDIYGRAEPPPQANAAGTLPPAAQGFAIAGPWSAPWVTPVAGPAGE